LSDFIVWVSHGGEFHVGYRQQADSPKEAAQKYLDKREVLLGDLYIRFPLPALGVARDEPGKELEIIHYEPKGNKPAFKIELSRAASVRY
jgi:hypothetical protein